MTSRFLLFLIFLFPLFPEAQSDISRQKLIVEQELASWARPPQFAPASRNNFHGNVGTSSISPVQSTPYINTGRMNLGGCMDSSFTKDFETSSLSHVFTCSIKTADGGFLAGGFGRNQWANPIPPYSCFLTKYDSKGNHIWSRQINSDVAFSFEIESIYELSDGSIIVTGWHDKLIYTPPTDYSDLFVCKLTSTGDLVWLKTFHSTFVTCSSGNIRSISVAEGLNGDLYFAGTLWNCPTPKNLVTFKLDNSGILQWSYTYAAVSFDGYAVGIFYENGSLTVINKNGDVGISDMVFLKLNSSTGNLISKKTWRGNSGIFNNVFVNQVKASRLTNGNYCIYGVTFGAFNTSSTPAMRYAILEFNPGYDFVNGLGVLTPPLGNYEVDQVKINADKRIVLMMFNNNLAYPNVDEYIATIVDGEVQNERKRELRNTETFYPQIEMFDDGSYVLLNSLATVGQSKFWVEYSLMHDADTSSTCLGIKTGFATLQAMTFVPQNFDWAVITPNAIVPTTNQNNNSVPVIFTAGFPCIQKAKCDTLKIHGPISICDYHQDMTFTTYKSAECGLKVKWTFDPAVLQAFQVLNDTSVKIRLNQAWQGWVYAQIPASCGIIKDSIWVTAGASPGQVNLGPDITICGGNMANITAPAGYVSYTWNTGATSALITVNIPGSYSLIVTDACGTSFYDTVNVFTAPPVVVSIGPDRIKCNDDTIHLAAPSGFLNYSWGPNYFLNTSTGADVIVRPLIDTIYFVRVEKSPGCYGYDTVRIASRISVPIQLGADVSICAGDSIVFDAGPGFTSYAWSNGALNQSIKAYMPGKYYVEAVNANQCYSRDTVSVLNVWNKPNVQLDHSSGLCEGSTRVLNAGNFSSYLWQDGSNLSSFLLSATGTYHVTVTDEHSCKASDTTRIITLYNLPFDFIKGELEICNFGTSLLTASSNFKSYAWNTNATSPSLCISGAGEYWLRVVDHNGCIGRDTVEVTVKECLKGFYVPKAFTPNNDGLNDVFKPVLGGIVVRYVFTVYNRWGEKVFSTSDPGRGWDGRYKGVIQDNNVSVWTCSYQFAGEPVKFAKGSVLVIK